MSFAISPSSDTSRIAGQVPAKAKAEKAACDFESVLLGSLLESLQKTFAGTPGGDSSENSSYAAMGAQALASAMSARGGIGIAQMILCQWRQTKVLGTN